MNKLWPCRWPIFWAYALSIFIYLLIFEAHLDSLPSARWSTRPYFSLKPESEDGRFEVNAFGELIQFSSHGQLLSMLKVGSEITAPAVETRVSVFVAAFDQSKNQSFVSEVGKDTLQPKHLSNWLGPEPIRFLELKPDHRIQLRFKNKIMILDSSNLKNLDEAP